MRSFSGKQNLNTGLGVRLLIERSQHRRFESLNRFILLTLKHPFETSFVALIPCSMKTSCFNTRQKNALVKPFKGLYCNFLCEIQMKVIFINCDYVYSVQDIHKIFQAQQTEDLRSFSTR